MGNLPSGMLSLRQRDPPATSRQAPRFLAAVYNDQLRQLTPSLVEKKLGWLEDYRAALSRWEELWLISEQICTGVRAEGYHGALTASLQSQLPAPVTESGALLIAQVLEFSNRVQAEVGKYAVCLVAVK
jgi:hypothetical protein